MKEGLITQHNLLTTARYEMSSLQKNIIYIMISQLHDNLGKKQHKVPLSLLEDKKGVRIRQERALLAAKKLISSGISIYDEAKRTFVTVGILASADYSAKQSSHLILEFDELMYPFLLNLKERFTTYRLQSALNLKSRYSKRLYEMLSQFKDTKILTLTVKELKMRLGLIDPISLEERYTDFHMFTQKVLKVAQKEISKYTELSFSYTATKTGRKYTDLSFHIQHLDSSPKVKSNKILSTDAPEQQQNKYPHPKLSGDALKQYLYLTQEVRWLDKKMAYKVIQTLPENTLWEYIHRYRMMMQRGDKDRPRPQDFFKEILERRALKAPDSKEKSPQYPEKSIWGKCYRKMAMEFGLPVAQIMKLAPQIQNKIKDEEFLTFLGRLLEEIKQNKILQSQNSGYLIKRLIEEYKLAL